MVLSLRLGDKDNADQVYIDRLIKAIMESGKPFDEVWIATPYRFVPLEESKEIVKSIKRTAEKFQAIGITPSLQISRTIGHSPLLLKGDTIDNSAMNRIVFMDGNVSPGRLCWNNEHLRKYIYESTKIYAAMHPEVVWIDDDLRIYTSGASGASALCFCDHCIRLFNARNGYTYNRESLRKDFLESKEIREEYIAFHIMCLTDFAGMITKAVRAAAPDAYMALQGGNNGQEFVAASQEAVLKEMQAISGHIVGFRAGGGVYCDHDPRQIIRKAMSINHMHSRMPEYATMRTCEIENLPFVAYGKSVEGTCIEAAVYMAYGCNMASVTLMNQSEPLSFHQRSFQKLAKYKPYFEKTICHNAGTTVAGLTVYQSPNAHLALLGEEQEASWCQSSLHEADELLRCGIPVHAGKNGNIYYLSQKTSQYLTKEDVEYLLKQPVMTDAASVQNLIHMGFEDAIGLHVIKNDGRLDGTAEVMTDHCVNHGFAARTWSASYYFHKEEKYILEGSNMEVISNYCKNGEIIGCAVAVITTTYGAKWLVQSANMGSAVISFTRRNQLISSVNYIAERPLPAYVNTPDQILIVPRVNEAGKTVSATLLNMSVSDGEDMEIVIENPANTEYCTIMDPYAEDKRVELIQKNGKYTVKVEKLNPWRVKTILL